MFKVKVGDEVFVRRSSGWRSWRVDAGKVEKVTPSGQIVVSLSNATIRFRANGTEIGASSWSSATRLVTAEEAKKIRQEMEIDGLWATVSSRLDAAVNASRQRDVESLKSHLDAIRSAIGSTEPKEDL